MFYRTDTVGSVAIITQLKKKQMKVVKLLIEITWSGHKSIFLTLLLNHLQIVQLSKLDIV